MFAIYKSKSLSIVTNVRTFNAFASSVFLYNSELWTVTDTLEKKIEECSGKQSTSVGPRKFHQQIYTPKRKSRNGAVTKRRRLNWLGHMMRMDKETPVRKALRRRREENRQWHGSDHWEGHSINCQSKAESRHCRPNHPHSHTSDKGLKWLVWPYQGHCG